MTLKNFNVKLWIKKIFVALVGIMFMGFGVALNVVASFGNDPISVFYDGIKNYFQIDFGTASTAVNCILLIIIFLLNRKYIGIGTLLYTVFLGILINLGLYICDVINLPNTFVIKILCSIIGCLMIFLGIAIYILISIGLDTWSGMSIIISEKFNVSYKFVKIIMDVICLIAGFFLGGVAGITTIFAAILGGPVIELFRKKIQGPVESWIKK